MQKKYVLSCTKGNDSRVKKVMAVSNVDCYCKNIYLEAYILSYFYYYLSLDLFYSLIILIAVLTLTRKKFVST